MASTSIKTGDKTKTSSKSPSKISLKTPKAAPTAVRPNGRPAKPGPAALAPQPGSPVSGRPADSTSSAAGPGPGKQARVLSLLGRPHGATIDELMESTGWMSHSVRGLLSAVIKRKLGLALASAVEPPRGRVYRIPMPAAPAGTGVGGPAAPAARRGRSPKPPAGTPANAGTA